MFFIWIAIFVLSIFVLVKGADLLLESAQTLGKKMKLPPFVIGITIVAVGTSLPELVTSLVATYQGLDEYAIATAVGANIINILLVIGVAVLVARRMIVKKKLIHLDIPVFALSTAIFLVLVMDGMVGLIESIILFVSYITYVTFSILYKEDMPEVSLQRHSLSLRDLVYLILGIIGLAVGSKYLVDSVVQISSMLNISSTILAITVVALGTSLPELVVSIKTAVRRQTEILLGNIIGSNIFRMLGMVGLSGLISVLRVDVTTYVIGLTFLIISTLILVISSTSRRITLLEGALYIVLYILFVGKIFYLF